MPLGLFGYGDHTCNATGTVGVLLKSRILEILRIMLLASSEMNPGSCLVFGKCQRESNLDRRPIRAFSFAFEPHGRRGEDARCAEFGFIRMGVFRFHKQDRPSPSSIKSQL